MERAIRYALEAEIDPTVHGKVEEYQKRIGSYSEKVTKTSKDAIEIVEYIASKATDDAERQFADETIAKIEQAYKDHDLYDVKINSVLEKLKSGNKYAAFHELTEIEKIEEQLDASLLALSESMMKNATDAAARAETKEKKSLIILMTVVGISFFITIILSIIIVRSIIKPLSNVQGAMSELATGNLEVAIPEHKQKDELLELVKALEVFKAGAIEQKRLAEAQAAEDRAKAERAEKIQQLVKNFDEQASDLLDSLSASATEMEATSNSMSSLAEETSSQATTVSAAANEAGASVQTVASAATELSASIREIASQVQKSEEGTQKASHSADSTKQKMAELSETVGKSDLWLSLSLTLRNKQTYWH
ncbi:MAG: HAMP domain-containing protein [Alphaproteobacteria bacterium]|nr:HAMP domain-containing protein [Alphaproteobacteria bacterium]